MKKILLLIPIIFLYLSVCGMAQSLVWEKIFHFNNDVAHGISKSNDSTFYVCGNSGFGVVLKMNKYGDTLWTKRFLDTTVNYAYTVAATNDGGCIISGYWDGLFALKLSPTGSVVWKKIYKVPGIQINKLIKGDNNYYYGCGYVSNLGFIFKIDDLGNLIWTKYLNTYSSVHLDDICFDSKTNSLVSVGSVSDNGSVFGYALRFSTDSTILFQKKYRMLNAGTNAGNIIKYGINFFISGATIDSSSSYAHSYLLKINNTCDSTYSRIFPTTKDETIGSLFMENKKLIFSSYIFSPFIGDTLKVKLFTTDTLGNILNYKYIIRTQGSKVNCGLQLTSNYSIFAGYIKRGTSDIWVLKTDSLFDFVPVSINSENQTINNFQLSQNYPNPFNPSTKISYSLKKSSEIELKLFNINGRMIKIIESGFKPAGSYEINFSAEDLSSGVYFFSLYSEGILMDTKKAVVVK